MNQNTLKLLLGYLAAIVAAFLAASASGALPKMPPTVVQWVSFAGVVLGIFGASPIGRVVGQRERREVGPTFPAPDVEIPERYRKPAFTSAEEITADERPRR